jgi:hypothetical protein
MTGDEKVRRCTDERNGRCDGVHLYGRAGKAAYTDSVLNILISSLRTQPSRNVKVKPAMMTTQVALRQTIRVSRRNCTAQLSRESLG